METLKRRLAEGEVTPEQFENMKRQLGEEERRP
ncbi:MAG: SHOCT domain-containing protein [Anaerolineales bacterium]